MATKKAYKFSTGLGKSLKNTLITAIPIAITVIVGLIPADVQNMTVAGLLVYITNLIANWLKNK